MSKPTFTAFAAFEKQGWSDPEVARSYADGFAQASQMCVAPMVAAVGAGAGSQALDLCCGQGIVAAGLHQAKADVTGLDFSPAMLDLARERVPGVTFVEGDAMQLPFEDGQFDVVTIGFGILHVPDAPQVLAQAHRVLRPGGRLAFSVWHAPTVPTALGYVFAAIGAHGDPAVQLPPGPGLHDYADAAIAYPALERAGFTECAQQVVHSAWTIDQPDAPVTFFAKGAVRGKALLASQPEAALTKIRQSVAETVRAAHGATGPWTVPIPAVITSAQAT
ncbi:methyltransferase domain-containing protein [Aliisedimentitalea scapharcae]|uniref:Methyltransferase domain-containing protein n=1 Tax=Aliisedimentitalea scapharcae TaxID=1524259 RepID=A0ABZ2XP62_9RHOB